MERPNLKEVKEHFKDAKIVKSLYQEIGNKDKYRGELKIDSLHTYQGDYWCHTCCGSYQLLVFRNGSYAEILEYKKPTKDEVLKFFKGAELVEDHTGFKSKHIPFSKDDILEDNNRYFARVPFTEHSFIFWDRKKGFAEILKYKAAAKFEAGMVVDEPTKEELKSAIENKESFHKHVHDKISRLQQNQQFDKVVEDTLENIRQLLVVKGKEYRRNNNPFHNFDTGAAKEGKIREEVLHGFRLKHEISVSDMRHDLAEGKLPTKAKVEEKYDDIILYYLIEKASMLDRIDNQKE